MVKFEISIIGKHDTNKYTITGELKDYLYHKLLERVDSRERIMDQENLKNLAERYHEEIKMILRKIKVVWDLRK